MATYRELLQQVREQIEEIGVTEAARLLESAEPPLVVDVRERHEWDEGRLPNAVHIPRGSLESRIERAAPDRSTPILVYCGSGRAVGLRREDARGARLRARHEPRRRHRRVETERPAGRRLGVARAGATHAVQPPHPHPRGRRGRATAPARGAHPPDRRRRPRLSRCPLPRCRGRGHARHRRRRRRRCDEPPAPDRPLDRPAGRAESRVRQANDRSAEPRRERPRLPRAADVRERRPHPRRGLGRRSSTAPTTSRRDTS